MLGFNKLVSRNKVLVVCAFCSYVLDYQNLTSGAFSAPAIALK